MAEIIETILGVMAGVILGSTIGTKLSMWIIRREISKRKEQWIREACQIIREVLFQMISGQGQEKEQ